MTVLCSIISVILTILCGWLAYVNAKLSDEVDYFSARYNELYDENKKLREDDLMQSVFMKTSNHEQDFKNFMIDEDQK